MIQHIDGVGMGQVNLMKAADNSYNVVCVDENTGAPIDLTTGSASLEVYSDENKGGTLTSLTGTLGTVAGGHFTIAVADDEAVISDYAVGTKLYAYAKATESGGTVHIADNPIILKVV